MSAINPHSNLERNLSSKVSMSFGGLSEVKTICLPEEWSVLNVWKNSSCVLSFPIINCMSSMSSTSTVLYFSLNFVIFEASPLLMQSITSLVNTSDVTHLLLHIKPLQQELRRVESFLQFHYFQLIQKK